MSLIVVSGYMQAIRRDPSLHVLRAQAPFTILIVGQLALYWLMPHLVKTRKQLPFFYVIQGTLSFVCGLLTSESVVILPLYMSLASSATAQYWPNHRTVALSILFSFGLMSINLILDMGVEDTISSLPDQAVWFALIIVYTILFVHQMRARRETQGLLRKLQAAHAQLQTYAEQVEVLTISQERQRMAQELHDTLVQGVAGLILQLEAVDSHMESNRQDRAHKGLRQAMQRARHTLHEARRAIRALRSTALETNDLVEALHQEAEHFGTTTGLHTTFEADAEVLDVPPETAQDVLRIVQESLSNVRRHAQANRVSVRLSSGDAGTRVAVQDDGVGFSPSEEQSRPDCFGLVGMQERAQRIGGTLQIKSASGEGTTITLDLGGTAV
jgi:NarL family two-component system sensor histidine kinase YdfH